MRIALVITPFNDSNLQLAAQLGVEEIVGYDMNGMPDSVEALAGLRDRVARFGMEMNVIEGGPRMDRIVVPKEGRDAQIEEFKRSLDRMGRAGIKILCYNFMPWGLRVARTSYAAPERAGALTSAFNLDEFDDAKRSHEGETSAEQMWESLEYFLRRVVPAAEAAGVKLALHPDDPPLPRLRGLARIFGSVAAFERLIALVPSECNGLTFCQGCFAEMGADIPAAIRRLGRRIHFVHFRDVRGTPTNFHESFHDNGNTDMAAAMRTYREIGFAGPARPDHVPLLEGEPGQYLENYPGSEEYSRVGPATGYTMQGRLFAVGYLRGLIDAIYGRRRGDVKAEPGK
ncbi:MAG: mannonate dehydratase [Opitutaceae bacterium]